MIRLFAALMAVFLCLISGAAWAQPVCGERQRILDAYPDNYKGPVIYRLLNDQNTVIETTLSKSGRWTVIVTTPNGVTCLFDHGPNMEQLKPNQVGEPS